MAVPDDSVLRGRLHNSDCLKNMDGLSSHLSVEKRTELVELVASYPGLFGDMPSRTNLVRA